MFHGMYWKSGINDSILILRLYNTLANYEVHIKRENIYFFKFSLLKQPVGDKRDACNNSSNLTGTN